MIDMYLKTGWEDVIGAVEQPKFREKSLHTPTGQCECTISNPTCKCMQ